MSFTWRAGDRELAMTHRGMARVRFALRDVLDGPWDVRSTWWYLRDGRHATTTGPRVRVHAVRTNDGRLTVAECELIAATLERLVSDEEREGLADAASFFRHAATQGGAREGLGLEAEAWTPPRPPPFTAGGDVAGRVGKHVARGEELARAEGHSLAPTLDGLAALDGLARRTTEKDAARARALACCALEALRTMHGGTWGVAKVFGIDTPAVQLGNGTVYTLVDTAHRFEPGSAPSTTLVELGEFPAQL